MKQPKITRRTVLRGLGVSMALPWLEAMGGGSPFASAETGAAASAAPKRMGFVFVPNGMNMDHFTPATVGPLGELPPTLQPLAKMKDELLVLTNLAQNNARALGDGPGDHARASAAFLTGAHPHKTAGKDIRVGISVDQFAAQRIGKQTPFPSLELSCDRSRLVGNCDSGYSCAYVSNISWRNETTPVPAEVDPGAVFERLFGSADVRQNAAARAERLATRRSILDFVRDDTHRLQRQLGTADQRKLDEFQHAIREIELRVQQASLDERKQPTPDYQKPDGVPPAYAEHIRLMFDMMLLAWQMDLTRITSFMIARAGSNRSFADIGVSDGHHYLSHHGRDAKKIDAIRKIDKFHMEQFAWFLQRLADTPDTDGKSLLENSMIMLGSGISDGNRHNHNELPVILAGRGGGTIRPGRHLQYAPDTPLCNLFNSMMDRCGIDSDSFGDSNGKLNDLV
jgi:hypothetical protein